MRKRLFAFGCSYTRFEWLTWVDFLSPYFYETHNFGISGAGNTYIFNTFANLAANDAFRPKDTIIIEWSSLLRENKIFAKDGGYKLGGYVYSNVHYDTDYISKYFNPLQTAFELVSFITSVKSICKEKNLNLKMFYMLPPWIEDFFGEPVNVYFPSEEIKDNVENIFMDSRVMEVLKGLYDDNFIKPSLEEYNLENKTHICYLKHKFEEDQNLCLDHHPAPNIHFQYSHLYILPWLRSIFNNLKDIPHDKLKDISEFWTKNLADKKQAEKFYDIPINEVGKLLELGYSFPHKAFNATLYNNQNIINNYNYKYYNKYYKNIYT